MLGEEKGAKDHNLVHGEEKEVKAHNSARGEAKDHLRLLKGPLFQPGEVDVNLHKTSLSPLSESAEKRNGGGEIFLHPSTPQIHRVLFFKSWTSDDVNTFFLYK